MTNTEAPPPSTTPKPDQLLRFLSRRNGMSAPALYKVLDWQPHTLRAAVSRFRKAGHLIETDKAAKTGVTLYRLTAC